MHTLWRGTYLYSLYKGLPSRGEKRVADYEQARLISPEQSWLSFLDLDMLPRNRYKIHGQVVQIKHFTAPFYG